MKGLSLLLICLVWLTGLSAQTAWAASKRPTGVIRYDSLPTQARLQADLPRIRQLLNVGSLRFYLPLSELTASRQTLNQLTVLTRRAGFSAEAVLTNLDHGHDNLNLPLVLPAELSLIALERPLTPAGRSRFVRLYRQLDPQAPAKLKRGIVFKLPGELHWLQTSVPAPDRWLLDFQAPVWRMHGQIRRSAQLLGRATLELARASAPELQNEYAQTWWLRFGFYFSKKYGLLPAAMSLHDSPATQGLLRPDGSLRPAFWLTQVYYQVGRIDLDEPKLTAALYEPTPEDVQLPEQPEAFSQEFLEALYKVRSRDSMLPYLASRQSQIFYDFLQLRSEESLLNSHFARLTELDQRVLTDGSRELSLRFVSALGDFGFNQRLSLIQPARHSGQTDGWRVSELSEPLLRPDYDPIDLSQPEALPLTRQIAPQLESKTQSYLQPDGSHRLWFSLRNRSQQALDLQPLALTAPDGKVYMPLPVEAALLRQLAPGERVEGSISFESRPSADYNQQTYAFKAETLPSEAYAPRALDVRARVSDSQLHIDITNPLIERLLLPVIRVQLRDGQKLYSLRYVLPQALLPLERKHYQLPLPEAFKPGKQAGEIQALGASYPIVDLEINLDDAWRSKQLGHWPQALLKYQEILRRFEPDLSPLRRALTLRDLLWLQFRLRQDQAGWQTLARIQQIKDLPRAERGLIYYELAEWLVQQNQPVRALELLALGRSDLPGHLPLLRLQAYALLRANQPRAALATYLSLLERSPQEIAILTTVTGLHQRLGQYRPALDVLIRLYALAPQRAHQLTIGSLHQRLGNHAAAIQWYRRYLSGGNDPRVTLDIAWLYTQLKQPAAALEWYRRALNTGASPEHWLTVAGLERSLNQRSAALISYGRYLNVCSRCPTRVWADAAYLARKLGQPQLAERYYLRHLALTGSAESRRALAGLYRQRGQRARALQTLRPLAQNCRNCRALLLDLADLARGQGRWPEALGYYRRLGPLTSLPADLRYDLTFGALQAGDAVLTQELMGSLSRLSASRRAALNRELAGFYRRQGQPARALELLIELWQRNPDARNLEDLLSTALEAGQGNRLVPLLAGRTGLAQLPPNLSAIGHYLIGKWAYEQQDYVTATERLKSAVRASQTTVGEHYRLLAAAYRALGQNDCAIAWLERADALLAGQTFSGDLPPGCN